LQSDNEMIVKRIMSDRTVIAKSRCFRSAWCCLAVLSRCFRGALAVPSSCFRGTFVVRLHCLFDAFLVLAQDSTLVRRLRDTVAMLSRCFAMLRDASRCFAMLRDAFAVLCYTLRYFCKACAILMLGFCSACLVLNWYLQSVCVYCYRSACVPSCAVLCFERACLLHTNSTNKHSTCKQYITNTQLSPSLPPFLTPSPDSLTHLTTTGLDTSAC
jgi:hypothetical protein